MIVLLDDTDQFASELARATQSLEIRRFDSVDAVLRVDGDAEAVLIGPGTSDPVRACQSLRRLDIPILICAPDEQSDTVRRQIQFAPLVPPDVVIIPECEKARIADAAARAADRARKRRRFVASVNAANQAIATAAPAPGAGAYIDRLLEIVPLGILVTDRSGVVLSSNRRAAQLLGTRDLSGAHLFSWFPNDAVIRTLLDNPTADPAPCTRELAGRPQHLEVRASRFTSNDGEDSVLFVLEDVTERVEAEQERGRMLVRDRESRRDLDRIARELFESERSLRLALAAGKMGTWRWDAATNKVIWSESLEAIYGLAPGSFGGTYEAFLAMVHPSDREYVMAKVADAGKDGPDYQIEFRAIRAGGAVRWIADRGQVLFDASGNRTGITGVCWDDTERKRVEEEVARALELEKRSRSQAEAAADQLRQMNGELEQFAYVASHDLQEPLRTIASFAQLLQRKYRGQLTTEADDYIDRVVQGAKRMQMLIRDLLDYSRVTRADEQETGDVDMEVILVSTIESLRIAIAESEAVITHDPLPHIPGANASRMLQLLQNLVGNSIKYARPGVPPTVHIGVRREREQWRFSVADNGLAFDPEYADRIFGLFKRLHGGDVPGTGIGLALCRRIVERHGGRIWAQSKPGAGSTFYFTLPA